MVSFVTSTNQTEWLQNVMVGEATSIHSLLDLQSLFGSFDIASVWGSDECETNDPNFVYGKFHTKDYGEHKATINSGVCIKGSCYNEFEKDYYGVLTDVIQFHYVGSNSVTLFNCHWYDSEKGVKVDSKHGILDINLKSRLGGNDPFVLAEQAQQVYYTKYPARKRSRIEWCAVYKTKARNAYNIISDVVHDNDEQQVFYQEEEMPPPTIVLVDFDLDQVVTLPSTEVEEVEPQPEHESTINPSVDDLDVEDEEEFEEEESEEDEDDFELSDSDDDSDDE
ncbi:G-patch and R3H domain-containing protein [Tanacetum coccineum]